MFTTGNSKQVPLNFQPKVPAALTAELRRELPGTWLYCSGRYGLLALKTITVGPFVLHWMHLLLKAAFRLQELVPDPAFRLQLTVRGHLMQEIRDFDAVEYAEGYNDLFCMRRFRQTLAFPEAQHAELLLLDVSAKKWMQMAETMPPLQVWGADILELESCRLLEEPVACDLFMLHLIQEWKRYVPGNLLKDRLLELQLEEWLLLVLQRAAALKAPGLPLSSYDRSRLREARALLDGQVDNLEVPLTEQELSRKSALNMRKLKEGFKLMFGTTVYGYLRSFRMYKALQMLIYARLEIGEVARRLGYKQRRFFIQAFRRTYGVDPGFVRLHRDVL